MKNPKISLLQDFIRNPYVWPGGYAKALVMMDGELLCQHCAKENYRQISYNTKMEQPYNRDWAVVTVSSMVDREPEEETETCAHCYLPIDNAKRLKKYDVRYKFRQIGAIGVLSESGIVMVEAFNELEARSKAISAAYEKFGHCEHVTPIEVTEL